MISFSNVSKRYGQLTVLRQLNFSIESGEIVGLLGPNGAGKTTTLKALTGVLPPSQGVVTVDGSDPLFSSETKRLIGFLPESNPLYDDMTVEEWLRFWSKIKHDGQVSDEQILKSVERAGLSDVYYRFIGQLSKGYRQRVGLAQAILSEPKILVLDEPTEGLDPNQRKDIHTLIRELGKDRTVIISSHVLSEITHMCNRVMILHQGKIVGDGTPDDLAEQMSGKQLVTVIASGRGILGQLKKLTGVSEVSEIKGSTGKPSTFKVSAEPSAEVRLPIFKLAATKKWQLYELHRQQVGLEEIFSELTK